MTGFLEVTSWKLCLQLKGQGDLSWAEIRSLRAGHEMLSLFPSHYQPKVRKFDSIFFLAHDFFQAIQLVLGLSSSFAQICTTIATLTTAS